VQFPVRMHERERAHRHAGHRDGDIDHARPAVGKLTLVEALGEGEALPDRQRARFEHSLGKDLSGVRIHRDFNASRGGGLVLVGGAPPATVGSHIAFADGQYNPDSSEGEHMLAHEVAHAAQQGPVAASTKLESLTSTRPGDATELDAHHAARAMVAGLPVQVGAAPIAIARLAKDESVEPAEPTARAPGAPGAPGASEDEIGELTADRIGQEEDLSELAPEQPAADPAAARQDIAAAGQQGAEPAEAPAAGPPGEAAAQPEGTAPGSQPTTDAGGGSAGVSEAVAHAQQEAREAADQAEAESTAFRAEMQAGRERFEADQQATTLAELKSMSPTEKRATLAELGYDPKYIQRLKDSELDGVISGKLEAEARKTTILGMSPEELAALPAARKLQYLVDLGIDRADLDKAGTAKCERLFNDIMRAAHVPGTHKVKIQIKGGLFGKSWVVTVKCDAEGDVDVQAKKEGGFLSKLVGWIKAALPIILGVLAPLTAGISLIALSVYQTVLAIKSGDWLGAITGIASAFVGIGAIAAVAKGTSGLAQAFSKIATVAGKVKIAAETASAAMLAAKAKNPASLLGALAVGAASFAKFAADKAGKFATTMTRWSERLTKASKIVSGGQTVVAGIRAGDPIAAIGGAFETAGAVAGGSTAKQLQRASTITTHVNAGRKALQSDPPDYAAVANAAFGIATQLEDDRRIEDAQRIFNSANRLKQAWDQRATNPGGLLAAALGLAESVQLAKYDLEHDEEKDADGNPVDDAARASITARYQRATRVAQFAGAALTAATARPRPNFLAMAEAVTQLLGELTDDQRLGATGVLAAKVEVYRSALASGDERRILAAGYALGEALNGVRTAIQDEREEARREAEAQLPPGETLPDDGGELPAGPDPADRPAAADPSAEQEPTESETTAPSPDAKSDSVDANYTVAPGDTLSGIAQRFSTTVGTLRTLNGQLVEDTIYLGQRLNVPGAEVQLEGDVTTSERYKIEQATIDAQAEAERTMVMAAARRMFDTITAQIEDWRKQNTLGGVFYGAVRDLELSIARLGTYVDDPGIGTNVVQREMTHAHSEFEKARNFFERQNSAKISAINAAIIAARVTKAGASVTLAVLDRPGYIKAGYEGAITGIEAYQAGAPLGMSILRGATQAVLEKVPIISEKKGVDVVSKSINEAFKVMGEVFVDVLAFTSRTPKPTTAELRAFVGQKVTSAALVVALAPMKGAIAELDTRTTNDDLPDLVHGATSTLAEMAEVVVQEIIEAEEDKKKASGQR
jgi:LysM repeat protein